MGTKPDPSLSQLGHHTSKHTPVESQLVDELTGAFDGSSLSLAQRLQAFARHVRRQDMARFLAYYELFKLSLAVNGSIVDCGVFTGRSLFSWFQLSSILEPYNHTRKVIGFDTFAGFPGVHDKDLISSASEFLEEGSFQSSKATLSEIKELITLHDQNRPLGHVPKVELVPGDACESIPRYVSDHPHLLVSLLYLDFDLYMPTKTALEHLYSRVVKGGIVAFDELNCQEFPGETTALLETMDLRHVALRRFPFEPYVSCFQKGE